MNEASGLRRVLHNPSFVFWLTTSHQIMPHVNILYNQLQKQLTDSIKINKALKDLHVAINQVQNQQLTYFRCLKKILHTELLVLYKRQNFRNVTGAITIF